METYEQALLLDVPVLLICAFLLLKYGNLSFSHPAISYLVFHVYVVTARLIGLISGDGATLYSKWQGPFDPVMPEEIARAALYFDIALVAMTITWLWLRWQRPRIPGESSRPLKPSIVWAVIVVSFAVGIVGLIIGAQLPGFQPNQRAANLGEWQSSSYIAITQTWCGLALLAYIYCYGFKRMPVVLLGIYLLIMTLQGYHRFRVVIPVIMLAQIWLDRRQLRWPPKWMVGSFFVAMFLFFPLKMIGKMSQQGASISEIGTVITDSVVQVLAGEADDQMFLDQLASALTLIDMNGRQYWGSIYLALFTLPIPRQWWPDKPTLAGFLGDISIPSRPMKDSGMVMTFIGEAYANFGILGVILIPPLLAAGLTALYRAAYRADYNTVVRFGYVLVCATLIQVYRDGLLSLVIFTLVNSLPLMMIVVIHSLPRLRPQVQTLTRPVVR
jgi:hypothetical protein